MNKSSKHIPKIALVGVPNVGKSSLLNRLIGSRAVIIDDASHTTRDATEHPTSWLGSSVILIDTPGFAGTSKDELVAAAQTQLIRALDDADAIIFVVNITARPLESEKALARLVRKAGKPTVLALNQADRRAKSAEVYKSLGIEAMIPVSAHHAIGLEELQSTVMSFLPQSLNADIEQPKLRVAFLGRPNVGKSSLLNALAQREAALVSQQAGTTRDPVAIQLSYQDTLIELTDTAGLRRPGKIGRDIEYFSLARTRQVIAACDVCILVVDAGEPATAQDQRIAGLIKDAGKGLVVAVNKIDAVELDESTRRRLDRRLARDLEFVWWAPYVLVSAKTSQHIDELMSQVIAIHGRLTQTFKTTELNKLLREATLKQPPSGTKNLHPRLNYITQTSSNPLIFSLFGTHPENVHFAYRRYLENQMRKQYSLSGVPVKLIFKSKYKNQE
ncbi:ribosome biogenesis GTPase Der [Candidatus Saccharibacteria bacterium]|nr:ribosome biogenesis GTPase Der [Candidatus Saccharibacteria bacterium]